VWFKKDSIFQVPRANITIQIRTPLAYATPFASVASTLFGELIEDDLNEFSYAADIAGLKYKINNNSDGLRLEISGYNDKQRLLLEKIVDKMANFKVNPERFANLKEDLILQFKNWDFESPHEHVMFYMTSVIQERFWSDQQKLEVLTDLQPAQLEAFAKILVSRLHIEFLFHGNLSRTSALEMVGIFESKLQPQKLYAIEKFPSRTLQLQPGQAFAYDRLVPDKENPNTAIEIFIQTGHYDDMRTRVLTILVEQCLRERFFDQLRTKQQLGYIVGAHSRAIRGSIGVRFLIESNFSPEYLERCIERFLVSELVHFQTLEESEYHKHVGSVITRKLEKNRSLKVETEKHMKALVNSYDFDYGESPLWNSLRKSSSPTLSFLFLIQAILETDLLKTLTKEDLSAFYERHFVEASQRAKLVCISRSQMPAAVKAEEETQGSADVTPRPNTLIDNLEAFKSSIPLSPHMQPSKKFVQLQTE